MVRTFTKSSKPNSNMADKQSNKKNQFSKTPVKIPSLQTTKKNRNFGESKQRFDKYGGKRVTLDENEKGKMGFFNKKSRGEKGSSLGFDEKNGEKRVRMDKNEKGKMGIVNKNPRGEKGSSLGFDEKNEKSRIPIKISSFEKMKMKNSEENGIGLLEKRKRTKKMSIKIDRYDFSNKRLDDGVVLDDITNKQKKKVEEGKENSEVAELSMNAQFRAIKPSPSIVTFVQENFLGRRRELELRRAGYNTELPAPLDNLPFTTSSERERVEESVFRNKLEFFAAAKVSSSFPPPDLPEIAFAGRSNVGKSSLLNALTRQWGVVRTSDKPGHTQSINFFNLGTKLTMVDLPGYGFAYAKDEVKEAWEDLVKEYVSTRVGLKRVCLLIDTKWGMKPRDMELIHLMERSQTKYQVVLTKTDVVFPIDVARRAMQIEERLKEHQSIVQPVMMVSSKSGAGIRCLRTVLGKMGRFLKP